MYEGFRDETRQIAKELPQKSETYLSGVTDLIKWTSTIIIAATLWIADNVTSIKEPLRIIALAALPCLIFALAIAAYTFWQATVTLAKEWALADRADALTKIVEKFQKLPPVVAKKQDTWARAQVEMQEAAEQYLEAISAARSASQLKAFKIRTALLITLLTMGIFCYALAQILNAL